MIIDNARSAKCAIIGWLLINLGLGESLFIPVGVPIPYPLATPPAGYLKLNGASFDKAKYPRLAAIYPDGVLPDMRGEFIRGWDDGRGADTGRGLLSPQGFAIQNITGALHSRSAPLTGGGAVVNAFGALALATNSGGSYVNLVGTNSASNADITTFDASRVASTAQETRPRNIAFNYIVRAA